jgi:hypothetical protein
MSEQEGQVKRPRPCYISLVVVCGSLERRRHLETASASAISVESVSTNGCEFR